MEFSDLTDLTSAIYDAREQVRTLEDGRTVARILHTFLMRAWDLPSEAAPALASALSGHISAGEAYRAIKRKANHG